VYPDVLEAMAGLPLQEYEISRPRDEQFVAIKKFELSGQ
jgi:hypothetical protein